MNPTTSDNRQLCYFALIVALVFLASGVSHAQEGAPLGLGDYLSQVKQGNTGTRGAMESSAGEIQRASEGELLLTTTAFANVQYAHDGRPQIVPITSYDFQDIPQYSIGISKLTDFGLQAKLSTNLYALSYEGTGPSSFATAFRGVTGIDYGALSALGGGSVNITNQLDLTQSLWGNAFGSSTQSNQKLIEAQALGQSYGNRYTARASLVDAENAYWRLVTARESVALTRDNLERAQKTYDWNVRRAHLQLADQSDALQSQAQLEARRLDYQRAQDDEVTASRAFNTARGVGADEVKEQLAPISPQAILAMAPPKRAEFRDDVKAAEQQSRVAVAGAQISRERDKPTLDVFATLALNGQNSSMGPAYSQALTTQHPTEIVGLRFSAPIAFVVAPSIRAGYTREEQGADLTYQRKVFEQEQGWKDLTSRLEQARRRLQLAVTLEKVQQEKLFHERERYHTGRTTAFQVLAFETDYAQSELNRIGSESDVLGALSQMKLYGEEL